VAPRGASVGRRGDSMVKNLSPSRVAPASGDVSPRASGATDPVVIPEYMGTETILLVDDEPMVRHFLSFVLTRYGYSVLEAENGEDALDLAGSHGAPVHLLLTDVVMPKLNGCELAGLLRRWYPGIGLLLMSGFADGEFAALNLGDDMAFFIRKPFGMRELAAAVRSALDWRPNHSPDSSG
jgi:two-component system, cell cycle sensor histidine kinase and response regulator CckA